MKKSLERVVGRYSTGSDGPTLIALGGLHGNEPAGLRAISNILDSLREGAIPLKGEFIGLAGNLGALERGNRFVEMDLNRIWLPDRIRRLRAGNGGASPGPDEMEQLELDDTLKEIFERAGGDVVFIDIHTSSASGVPFVFIGDTLRNRSVALNIPFPVILGLEEQLDGGLTEYLCDRGCVTVGIEAGQHDEPLTVDVAEGALWVIAAAVGMIDEEAIPSLDERKEVLRSVSRGVPPVLEVRFRHGITRREDFAMRPGYVNFQQVSRGEVLADEKGKEICAPESARMLLPLYQSLGNDGFFLAREFSPFWLKLSAIMRKMNLDRFLHWLPGVRKAKRRPGELLISTGAARYLAPQFFHLLGYRKLRHRDRYMVLTRRRFDRRKPVRIEAAL